MSNLYLPTTQARFSVSPTEFFGSPAYECLQPFLNPNEMELCLTDPFRKACAISAAAAVAAAAAEQTVPPNFHTYSAYYYDAMMSTRETSPCFNLYSTPSNLAAVIMNTKPTEHVQNASESAQTHSQDTHLPISSIPPMVVRPDPIYTSSGSHVRSLYPPDLSSPVLYGSHPFSMQLTPPPLLPPHPKSSPARRNPNKQNSPRPNRSWSCQCTCPSNTDETGICGRSGKLHVSETVNSQMEWDMFSSGGCGTNPPPFECAKSFIRRRNARERERVRCVNAGYELLRRRLPLASMSDRRLAKVEILRGAISYINSLKDMLDKTP
ncbi:Achaete-scute 4 [Fasciola gigantica]|uniref:Achaete-scute 4 n=1 Tax=Fasciola gigantica TaxID=46835 RepID=A0A504ZAZ8_FASGI|nr:Achaete-scute 4 [Fasciola gigantica]